MLAGEILEEGTDSEISLGSTGAFHELRNHRKSYFIHSQIDVLAKPPFPGGAEAFKNFPGFLVVKVDPKPLHEPRHHFIV